MSKPEWVKEDKGGGLEQWAIWNGTIGIAIYRRGAWYMTCEYLGYDEEPLDSDGFEEAQKEAIDLAFSAARQAYMDVAEIRDE